MAAGNLPEPGTKYGPCMDACAHRDCAETREMAANLCIICLDPIGYDSPFYQRSSPEIRPRALVHASCAEKGGGRMKITRQNDPALELASRIYSYREDGESWTDAVDRYAREVLFRHPRTVHRWLAGESPMPLAVIVMLGDSVRFSYAPEAESHDRA